MKLKILLLACITLFTCELAKAQEKKEYEMKTYYLVFLKKGPHRDQDSLTAANIQIAHLGHLTKMADEKKLVVAGPFMDDGDIRGICVYSGVTMEEAKQLANEDPAVKAGRLVVEIHPWYAAKGSCLP